MFNFVNIAIIFYLLISVKNIVQLLSLKESWAAGTAIAVLELARFASKVNTLSLKMLNKTFIISIKSKTKSLFLALQVLLGQLAVVK